MRVIIPPTGNETISMLKTTSLVSVIAVGRPVHPAQLIYGGNLQQVPLLVVASIWYLVLTSLLSVGQYYIERRYSRGAVPARSGGFSGSAGRNRGWHERSLRSDHRYQADAERVSDGMSDTPMVKAEGVHKYFGRLEVLQGHRPRGHAAARSCA